MTDVTALHTRDTACALTGATADITCRACQVEEALAQVAAREAWIDRRKRITAAIFSALTQSEMAGIATERIDVAAELRVIGADVRFLCGGKPPKEG